MLDAQVATQPPGGIGEVPPDLADLQRRQAEGEIAPDVDPALALLMLQSAVCAGVLFAHDVRTLAGLEPTSPEYLERYGALLRRVVRGLAGPAPEP